MELTSELSRRLLISTQEVALLGGDYHNGSLTVLIPFGIWGLLAWLWFIIAGTRALYLNLRYGDPELKQVNTLILALFFAKTIVFFVVFGNLYSEAMDFLGLIGLSISLNHGIQRTSRSVPVPDAVLEIESDAGATPVLSRS